MKHLNLNHQFKYDEYLRLITNPQRKPSKHKFEVPGFLNQQLLNFKI